MTVTFFGHKDAPASIVPLLEETIRNLIEKQNADTFYVGNHGNFDFYVARLLKKVKEEFSHIRYAIVLAYMPQKTDSTYSYIDYADTVLPEDVATGIPKFAICRRNDWMLRKSDAVVAYVTHSFGGAAQYRQKAIRQKKTVIDSASYT